MADTCYTLAVVGGGAACVSFLHHLVDAERPRSAPQPIKVLVFEKRPVVGPGYAYQDDTDALILNRVAGTMSISHSDPSMFERWLREQAAASPELASAVTGSFPDVYLPRRWFGRFLHDAFRALQRVGSEKGIDIEVVHDEVRRIEYAPQLMVLGRSQRRTVDRVLLAVGHRTPHDHYRLAGSANYIDRLFPFEAHADKLLRAKSVCILGSSLTAVDAVVALRSLGYAGSVDLLSVHGRLPPVKGLSYPRHELTHLTMAALSRRMRGDRRRVTLREALRLFRRELNGVDVAWKDILRSVDQDAESLLEQDIATAHGIRPWAPLLRSINDIVHELWNVLDDDAKHTFRTNFSRQWMRIRTPIPLQNALVLQSAMKSGQLRVYKGPASLRGTTDGYVDMVLANGTRNRYDIAVNATGDVDHIDASQSDLVSSLVRSGIACADNSGGVRVDFGSGALISRSGAVDRNIRALGRMTCGTYFYVDSLEMISRQARRVCDDWLRGDRTIGSARCT